MITDNWSSLSVAKYDEKSWEEIDYFVATEYKHM